MPPVAYLWASSMNRNYGKSRGPLGDEVPFPKQLLIEILSATSIKYIHLFIYVNY